MKLVSFVANDTAAALAEVHRQLGPEAIVVSVRKLRAPGLSWLWSKPQVEIVAGVPDKTSAPPTEKFSPQRFLENVPEFPESERWRTVLWMQAMGLLQNHANRLQSHLHSVAGDPPESIENEWKIVSDALSRYWLAPPALDDGLMRPHVFIGPAGSGKTTALCKWLTLATLLDGRCARVWRLDGDTANTATFLEIHCETLGVPVERFWTNDLRFANEGLRAAYLAGDKKQFESQKSQIENPLLFVDLPGVDAANETALEGLRNILTEFASPRVHLVLNAAYDISILLAQWRAFESFLPEDLIFTHFDEEKQRVKLWNFVFGTNCSVRFVGAGQKIPGEFRNASPELFLPSKTL